MFNIYFTDVIPLFWGLGVSNIEKIGAGALEFLNKLSILRIFSASYGFFEARRARIFNSEWGVDISRGHVRPQNRSPEFLGSP